MKLSKKIVLICFFCMNVIACFLIPRSRAQDIVYEGANTEHIPEFNVYPSEMYYYNYSGVPLFHDETYLRFDIVKGNVTNTFLGMTSIPLLPPLVNGTCIFGDIYMGNTTSGEEVLLGSDYQFIYWNETIGLIALNQYPAIFLPLNQYGEIQSLQYAINSVQWAVKVAGFGPFEHTISYPSVYSAELWNSTYNDAYYKMNFTQKGLQINTEMYNILNGPNITLISKPAQLPPEFSFTTYYGDPIVYSRQFTLNLTILSADNNNDGLPDTDYQYRVYENGIWSTWEEFVPIIDYNIGDVDQGNVTLTVEVKNMYGITQEKLEVHFYIPIPFGFPGFPLQIILIMFGFGISLMLWKYRGKYHK